MSGPIPALVVSLTGRTAEDARLQAEDSARAGADLAEVRLDLWPRAEHADLERLFPSPIPLIATLRSRAEGGEGPDDPRVRSERILGFSRLPFRWIDLEAGRDLDLEAELPPASQMGRIISSHYPAGVRPEVWARQLREQVPPGCVRKVVARSPVGSLFTELLPEIPSPGTQSVVALTTGPSGPLLRAWARKLAMPMVFSAPPDLGKEGGTDPPVETSQIPIDHLRPFLAAGENAPLFGLAGHPVEHTRSPRIHARWMARLRHPGLYVPLDFETEGEFVDSLDSLIEWGFRGLNVTHPWKSAAIEAATDVTARAEMCGVANTLTFRGTSIEAENTDLAAALRRLEELRRSARWDGRSMAVVGTGGAARATLAAARVLGIEAWVYGRHPESAKELAMAFDAHAAEAGIVHPSPLVVHATVVGRAGTGSLEFPLKSLLRPGTHVVDWVYAPVSPEIHREADSAGATYEDGRRLLVYQAAATFGTWWGEEPAPEAVSEVLREEGCTG